MNCKGNGDAIHNQIIKNSWADFWARCRQLAESSWQSHLQTIRL